MPKKAPIPPETQKMKSHLDKEGNLIDYFLVCGLSPSKCEEESLYSVSPDSSPLEIAPEILSKLPPFDKTNIGIDEGILNYLFPEGFGIKQYKSPPKPHFFSFILDNNFFSYEQPQKYVSCLLVYEPLTKYKYLQQYSKDNKAAPRFSVTNKKSPYYHLVNYYIPKCLCLVSIYPFINTHHKILNSLYNYSAVNNLTVPIEKFISSLIIEVPLPPRGLYRVDYQLMNEKIELYNTKMNELPFTNFNLKKICFSFSFLQISEIYKHILLETKIIFFSKDVNALCHIILGFIALIYPLKYPFQIASSVPKENYNLLESISPFIFGLNEEYKENFFEDNAFDISETNILCCDIDNGKIYVKSNEVFAQMPQKLTDRLERNITEYINSIDKTDSHYDPEFNLKIQNFFFEFLASLLKTYEKYLNNDYYTSKENIQNTNINNLFKVDEFINSMSYYDRDFYSKFVNDSQMFVEFIYKRMIPKNTKEKIDILFINEKINDMNNKSCFFPKKEKDLFIFLTSQEYNIKTTYAVPKPKDLTQNEFEELSAIASDIGQVTDNAQIITYNKTSKKLSFTYALFPVLNIDLFFNEINIKTYTPPPLFFEEIEAISTDIVAKSALNGVEVHQMEMENYIYLTWLELWAFSFWYVDKKERHYRFDQMITVLDKVIHHEMEVFDLLFDVLSKQNEDEMILKLYKKLIMYKLNPTIFIHSIIAKIIDRKQITALSLPKKGTIINHSDVIFNEEINDDSKGRNRVLFNKRTFKCEYEKQVVSENVKFNRYDTCIECSSTLDLPQISINFASMKKDVMWAQCAHCGAFNLPKLTVRIGDFVSNSQSITEDEVVLHSPYDLKVNVKEAINRECGIKLDIDWFKLRFNALFWNAIWYFALNSLGYDFLLPYRKNIFKEYKNETEFGNKHITISLFNQFDEELEVTPQRVTTRKRYDELIPCEDVSKVDIYETNYDTLPQNNNKISFINSYLDSSSSLNSLNESGFINPNNLLENSMSFDTMTKFSDSDAEIDLIRNKIRIQRLKSIKEDDEHVEFDLDTINNKGNILNFEDEEDCDNANKSFEFPLKGHEAEVTEEKTQKSRKKSC